MTFTISQTPDSQTLYIYPTGDSLHPFTPSTGSNNYAMVDDVWNNPDGTDFNYMTGINNLKDRYSLTNHTSETGNINYVRLIAYAKGSFSGTAPTLHLHNYLSTTEDEGSSNTLTNTYNKYYETYPEDPGGGAWSWTDIDNLLSGFKGTITAKECVYRTGDDTPSEELTQIEYAGGYIFVMDGDTLRSYTYSYDIVNNTFSFTEVDNHTITANTAHEISTYYNSGDDVVYIAWALYVSSIDRRLYLVKFDCSTETFSTITYFETTGPNTGTAGTCSHCYIDDTYVYASWCSKYVASSTNCDNYVTIATYTSSSMTKQTTDVLDNVSSGENLADYGCYDINAMAGASGYKYVICSTVNENARRIWGFRVATATHAISNKDSVSPGAVQDHSSKIVNDGTYFHVVYFDDSASDHDLMAFTYNGTTIAQSGNTSEITGSDNFKDMHLDSDDYLYTTSADDVKLWSFDGTDFTLEHTEQTGNGSTQLYGITGDNKYLFVMQDETTDNNSNSIALFEPSKVIVSQFFAVVNYTPTATVITLPDPKNVDLSHSRNIQRKNLPSGNYIVYDAGRGSKTLTIVGTETSAAYTDMNSLKTICHYGAKVTIAGLDDTNLNTDYWVSDIGFSAGPGYPANMYDYKLTLEEL